MQGRKENAMLKILHEVKLENEELFAFPPVCFQCEQDSAQFSLVFQVRPHE